MENSRVRELTEHFKTLIDQTNQVIKELFQENVEVKIAFNNSMKVDPPNLEILKLVEHRDYL